MQTWDKQYEVNAVIKSLPTLYNLKLNSREQS